MEGEYILCRNAYSSYCLYMNSYFWTLNSMKDLFVIENLGETSTPTNKVSPITLLAVFDGHGGASCSQFCSDCLSSYVRKNKFFPDRLPLAVETAFEKLGSDFVSLGKLNGRYVSFCVTYAILLLSFVVY